MVMSMARAVARGGGARGMATRAAENNLHRGGLGGATAWANTHRATPVGGRTLDQRYTKGNNIAPRGQHIRAYAASEIPVNTVCRMMQCKVTDEAAAMKMDALLEKAEASMKKVKGYKGKTRMVCKTYWDYKSLFRFDSVDSLVAYMEGDVREKELIPMLEEAKQIAVDGDVHMQNFVIDDN